MSDSVWYYARGEQEKGPITTVQIKALAGAGKLQQDDFVWKEGMENWVPAREVAGLFPEKSKNKADAQSELPTKSDDSRPVARPSRSQKKDDDGQTRAISRAVFAAGLMLALLSRGCDALSDRNVARREAISKSVRKEFQDEWDRKRFKIKDEQQQLQSNNNRTNLEDSRLQELNGATSKLAAEQAQKERELEASLWLDNDNAAAKAGADHRIWGYWRQAMFLFATVLLTISLLSLGYCSDGPERWISFVLVVVIVYSLYASDSVWNSVFS